MGQAIQGPVVPKDTDNTPARTTRKIRLEHIQVRRAAHYLREKRLTDVTEFKWYAGPVVYKFYLYLSITRFGRDRRNPDNSSTRTLRKLCAPGGHCSYLVAGFMRSCLYAIVSVDVSTLITSDAMSSPAAAGT